MNKLNTKKIVLLALLVALNIVLSRIVPAINAWNMKISLTFITMVIAGNLYGPAYSALVGALGDFIGSLLFPIGAYNPLFTLTALLSGLTFGIFFEKNMEIKYAAIECLANNIFVTLLLNSWFIAITYNASFTALLATRSIQAIVMFVVQMLLIIVLKPAVNRLRTSFK